jgi:hypothetical protein
MSSMFKAPTQAADKHIVTVENYFPFRSITQLSQTEISFINRPKAHRLPLLTMFLHLPIAPTVVFGSVVKLCVLCALARNTKKPLL